MFGGIALLGIIGLLADKITEVSWEEITKLVVKEQLKTYSKEEVIEFVKKISNNKIDEIKNY